MEFWNHHPDNESIFITHYEYDQIKTIPEDFPDLKKTTKSAIDNDIEQVIIAPYSLLSIGLNVLPEDPITLATICDVEDIHIQDTPEQRYKHGWFHIYFTAIEWTDEVDEASGLNYARLVKSLFLTKYTPGYHHRVPMKHRMM